MENTSRGIAVYELLPRAHVLTRFTSVWFSQSDAGHTREMYR